MKLRICMRIALLLCCLTVFSALPVSASEAGKSWYIPHKGQTQPSLSAECKDILDHDAYYMNTSKSDTDTDKVIYLTFDAGYENGNIEKILDVLKEEQVPGAFFILSYLCKKNTDLVKRMKAEGHLVCNHTSNHKNMASVTQEQMKENLCALEKAYQDATGEVLDKYFRFPEGRYSEQALDCAEELGYKTIFWSFGYADWDNNKQMSEDAAIKKIIDNTHNGEVILLHPTSKTNAAILQRLICTWRDMGYRFGTLDELCRDVDSMKTKAV